MTILPYLRNNRRGDCSERLAELERSKRFDMTWTLTTKYKPYPAYKSSSVEWLGEIPDALGSATATEAFNTPISKLGTDRLQQSPNSQYDVDGLPYLQGNFTVWSNGFKFKLVLDPPTMWANLEEIDQFGVATGVILLSVCEPVGEGESMRRSGLMESDVDSGHIIQNALHRVRPLEFGRNDFMQYCPAASHRVRV